MKSYLFSCGNSTSGTIGFCVRVEAEDEQEALEAVQAALPYWVPIGAISDDERIEYISIYINPGNITIENDLEDSETLDEDDEEDCDDME